MFGVEPHILVDSNRLKHPSLMASSKLEKNTQIELPIPDYRWILTKQIAKDNPEGKGKKKHNYTVEVHLRPSFPQLVSTIYRHLW